MKIELIKYQNEEAITRWKIVNDGRYINLYPTEEEAIEGFNKYVSRLQNEIQEPQIIKSIEI